MAVDEFADFPDAPAVLPPRLPVNTGREYSPQQKAEVMAYLYPENPEDDPAPVGASSIDEFADFPDAPAPPARTQQKAVDEFADFPDAPSKPTESFLDGALRSTGGFLGGALRTALDESGVMEKVWRRGASGADGAVTNSELDSELSSALLKAVITRALPESIERGYRGGENALTNIQEQLGLKDTREAASSIAANQRRIAEIPPSPEVTQALKKISDAKGFWDSGKEIISHPEVLPDVLGESFGAFAPVMAAAAGASRKLALAGITGIGSFGIGYGQKILESMEKAGVNTSDQEEVTKALNDKTFMSKAMQDAALYAGPVALVDAATGGVAGKLAQGASGLLSGIMRGTGELGIQAGGGMLGEGLGQIASQGEITSPSDVLLEGVAEVPSSVAEIGIGTGIELRNNRKRAAEKIAASEIPPPGAPSATPGAPQPSGPAPTTTPQPSGQSAPAAEAIQPAVAPREAAPVSLDEIEEVINGDRPVADIVQEYTAPPVDESFEPVDLSLLDSETLPEPATNIPAELPEVTPAAAESPEPAIASTSSSSPIIAQNDDDVLRAGADAASSPFNERPEPTQAQKEAGNYKKGHVKVQSLDISIETPRAGTRSGVDQNGEPWSVQMQHDYGYIKRTEGADGDHVDVYIGNNPQSDTVYVIDQIDPDTGKFDEHKALIGFDSERDAVAAYVNSFSDRRGVERIGSAPRPVSMNRFKEWLKNGDANKPFGELRRATPQPIIKSTRAKPARKPADLLRFLAQNGGIREESGELATLGINQFIPGAGRLVRKNGRQLDYARELAVEAGYGNWATVADFIDALAQTRGKKMYSAADINAAVDAAAERQGARPISDQENAVGLHYQRLADDLGIDTKDMDIEDMVAAVHERQAIQEDGATADTLLSEQESAIDQYLADNYPELAMQQQRAGLNAEKDIPFGDENDTTTQTPAQQETTGLSPERGRAGEDATGPQETGNDSQGAAVSREGSGEGAPVFGKEQTAAGEQSVIPGAERISDRELAERKMRGKSRSTKPQLAADEGIFDVGARGQQEMNIEPATPDENAPEINLPDPKNLTPEALYRTQRKIEKAFQNDAALPESKRMSDSEFAALEDYARRLEREIETRGKPAMASKLKKGTAATASSAPEATTKPATQNFKDDISAEEANRAFTWTSFTPEKRGEQRRQDYADMMQNDYDALRALAEKEGKLDIFEREWERYRLNIRQKYKAFLAARAQTASSMIAGPARFNTARNNKKNAAADNRYAEFEHLHTSGIKAIRKAIQPYGDGSRITADDPNAAAKMTDKVAQAERLQDLMKQTNAIIRSGKDVGARLKEIGHSETDIKKLLTPDFAGRTGYKQFEITNNAANIRRMKQRSETLEGAAGREEEIWNFDDGSIIADPTDNRLKITFEAIPSEEIRAKLKSQGFRWSPKNKAWQRQLTNQAKSDALYLFNAKSQSVTSNPDGSGTSFQRDGAVSRDNTPDLQQGDGYLYRLKKSFDGKEIDAMHAIEESVERIFGKDINLRYADILTDEQGDGVLGVFTKEDIGYTIAIAMAKGKQLSDLMKTTGHELIHALYRAKAFSRSEWNYLRSMARNKWMDNYNIESRYREGLESFRKKNGEPLTPAQIQRKMEEEAIAEAFGDVLGTGKINISPKAKGIFSRIREFLSDLRDRIQKKFGWNNVDDIFEKTVKGERANLPREDESADETPSFQRQAEEDFKNWRLNDTGLGQILLDRNKNFLDKIKKTPSAAATSFDEFRRYMQDRFIGVRRVQEAIERATGSKVPDSSNVVLSEETYSGRVGHKLDVLHEKHFKKVYDKIFDLEKKVGEGNAVERVDEFLTALHAPERNAQIQKISKEGSKFADVPETLLEAEKKGIPGSGMSNEEAAAVIEKAKKDGIYDQLTSIAQDVRTILDNALDERLRMMLIDRKTYDNLKAAYKDYFPLRGLAEVGIDGPTNFGKGFSVRGKEIRRAEGRQSRAPDVLANSLAIAEESILRGEKNRVGLSLYNMAIENPNTNLWKVSKKKKVYKLNESTGVMEWIPEPVPKGYKQDDNTVFVKVNGEEVKVELKDRRLAEAMKNLNAHQANMLMQMMMRLNQYLSLTHTVLNPDFLAKNIARDIQTALINSGARDIPGLAKAITRDYAKALVAAWREMGFDEGPSSALSTGRLRPYKNSAEAQEWLDFAKERAKAGGKVSFWKIDNVSDKVSSIASELGRRRSGSWNFTKKQARAFFELVERVNTAADNGIRLAVYAHGRRAGLSEAQAASLSKNITVNFNKRGEWGPQMNALYLFSNASIQGSAVMLAALKSKKVRRIALGITALSFLWAQSMAWLSPKDDDDELIWDKIPDYEKEANFIFVFPSGNIPNALKKILPWNVKDGVEYIKVPLAYGYRVFNYMGVNLADAQRGAISKWDAISNIAKSMVNNFSPIGSDATWWNTVSPTVLDPVAAIATNTNPFTGRQIYPGVSQYDAAPPPDSQRYFPNARYISKEAADALNSITGGDHVVPGAIDVSPETLDYMYDYFTGGAGAFAARVLDMGAGIFTDKEFGINDLVFARSLLGSVPHWADKTRAYDRMHEVDTQLDRYNTYKKADPAKAQAFFDKNAPLLRLSGKLIKDNPSKSFETANGARVRLSQLRKQKIANESSNLSAEDKKKRLASIEQEEGQVVSAFNRAYNRAMKKTAGDVQPFVSRPSQ